ncbi:NAD(P)/FAD-dependent oxidoreductase [Rathayibacter sp. YIM 133350]|uniref:flavin-containing monooxygenase n=1 Tax=Rathayibacter sp. YIM 133350 TaxID=3131992 RepID=UPI00307D38B0
MTTAAQSRPATASDTAAADGATRHARVLIIGAGFSGIGLAHRLRQSGVDDVVILERSDDVGGVWRLNTYPGCTCDVPSHLYSFSFAPNPEWSSTFSPQPEIREYLRACVDRFGLRESLRTAVEVTDARWDESALLWRLTTSEGPWTGQVLVSAVGPLTEPRLPDVPGIDRFRGHLMHSARWDPSLELTGRRVASIGTGASAIQYVPRIAEKVERLYVFQRHAPWVLPHSKRPIAERERDRYRRHPLVQRVARARIYAVRELLVAGFAKWPPALRLLEAAARAHLRRQVPDAALRRILTPDYRLGCKRMVPADDWYPALQRENVTVVASGLREIREHSVLDDTGAEHAVDTIIFGTGFHVTDVPVSRQVHGRGGVLLADAWRDSARAYLGASVPGFPNFFLMLGPNTGLGHSSMVYMAESQMEHIVHAIRAMANSGAKAIELRPEAYDAYNRTLDAKMTRTVWQTGGCASWYQDASGRNAALWPDWTFRFRRLARRWDPHAYRVVGRSATASTASDIRR